MRFITNSIQFYTIQCDLIHCVFYTQRCLYPRVLLSRLSWNRSVSTLMILGFQVCIHFFRFKFVSSTSAGAFHLLYMVGKTLLWKASCFFPICATVLPLPCICFFVFSSNANICSEWFNIPQLACTFTLIFHKYFPYRAWILPMRWYHPQKILTDN